MEFFVSWYQGDPIYPNYYPNPNMLISVTSVSNSWTIKEFANLPAKLIIDSGGFRYATTDTPSPSPKYLLERQLRLVANIPTSILLCALDFPLLALPQQHQTQDRLLHNTLHNAHELIRLVARYNMRSNIQLMGIIQGYDTATLKYSARELKAMGYHYYGIGSMARLYNQKEILKRIDAVVSVLGVGVHVFGVTSIKFLNEMAAAGVVSVDSTTPVTNAKYNTLLYSRPYRRYLIAHTRIGQNATRSEPRIDRPLLCDCPVCSTGHSAKLLLVGKREYTYLRTLHNYHHFRLTLDDAGLN
jgi:7-cyano-7-deazaguanine tRNA-ribosyltransferase